MRQRKWVVSFLLLLFVCSGQYIYVWRDRYMLVIEYRIKRPTILSRGKTCWKKCYCWMRCVYLSGTITNKFLNVSPRPTYICVYFFFFSCVLFQPSVDARRFYDYRILYFTLYISLLFCHFSWNYFLPFVFFFQNPSTPLCISHFKL